MFDNMVLIHDDHLKTDYEVYYDQGIYDSVVQYLVNPSDKWVLLPEHVFVVLSTKPGIITSFIERVPGD